jgi:hypothetical protein
MVNGLGANDSIVAKDSDLSPVGALVVVLRETTKVDKLTLRANLSESSAVVLAN